MFVTKKRLYTELCKLVDTLIAQGDAITDIRATHFDDTVELNDQIHSLSMTIKHLTERIEVLERTELDTKKTTKKQTKKTKRK